MGVIATLLPSAHLQRVRGAVRDRHEIVACANWAEVAEACASRPVQLLIADLFGGGGSRRRAVFESVRHLRRRAPQLTVIAYSAVTAAQLHDLFDAGREGIDGLVIADQDDSPRALLSLIEQAESSSLTTALREALAGVDEMVVEAMVLSVSRAHERLSPLKLAGLLALPRKVVAHRLTTGGFPSPQRLLTWGRLIMAAHLLEDPQRPADRVAASLAFPSGSAFRNVCSRYLHSTPGEIRRRGGASFVVRAMLRRTQARGPGAKNGVHTSSRRQHGVAL